MKKIQYISSILLAAVMLGGCQTDDEWNANGAGKTTVSCTMQDFSWGDLTRTAYRLDEYAGVNISWQAGDRIAVFPDNGSTSDFTISSDDIGKEKATFTGGFFMPRKGVNYYAVYPFSNEMLEDGQDKSHVTFNYETVTIKNWGSMDHLGVNDYMIAGPSKINSKYELEFDFRHLNSLMLLKVKLPADASYSKFEVSCLENLLVARASIDLTSDNPTLKPDRMTDCISAKLGTDDSGLSGKKGQEVNLFLMLPPQDLSGEMLYFKLYKTDGTSYIARFEGINLHQGSAYDYSRTTGVVEMSEYSANHRWVFVSDIHVGDKRALDNGYCWHDEMRQPFINFLKYMKKNGNYWDDLIVVGDLVDEWICPADMKPMADDSNNTLSSSEFFGKIVHDNQELFDEFASLSKTHHLHYISGNHDMQVEEEDFKKYLPGVFELHYDSKGLGSMLIDDIIWVEHGHRYDVYNAPFLDRNFSNGTSMIPPGYFVSRLITNDKGDGPIIAGIPGHPHMDGCPQQLQTRGGNFISFFTLGFLVAVNVGSIKGYGLFSEDKPHEILCDGQDGLKQFYTWDWSGGDIYWTEFNNREKAQTLYRDPSDDDEWEKRCKRNGSPFISFSSSVLGGNFYSFFDELSVTAMNEHNARICVFGHSHSPVLHDDYNLGNIVGGLQKCLYANTGGWVDESVIADEDFTGSWVEIDRSEFEGMKVYTVKLFQFDAENNKPILKDSRALQVKANGEVVGDKK